MAFWTMETMGQPLPDAVASTVRWREEAGPHLVTEQQVVQRVDACETRSLTVLVEPCCIAPTSRTAGFGVGCGCVLGVGGRQLY